ncbi:ribonuclease III [Candidatus Electronema sp. TJ]|uniref:ribonuclease III n=1 Tax=Candidatus Electronema sp. TJ TaxID=3401573 RepID=UPI003AA95A38
MGTTLEELAIRHAEQLCLLQDRIGHVFRDRELLQLALIHSSFAFERMDCGRHNETLEFLGDAALDMAVGHLLFLRFPDLREGKLTRIRAALVNEGSLADIARSFELGRHLLLGKGEDSSSGREKASILCGTYEALIGAMFLDSGYEAVQAHVRRHFGPLIDRQGEKLIAVDAKSKLQELLQERHNEGPQYALETEDGPPHARLFTVSVSFRERTLGTGTASSKKEAEQAAARAALELLQNGGESQIRADDSGNSPQTPASAAVCR